MSEDNKPEEKEPMNGSDSENKIEEPTVEEPTFEEEDLEEEDLEDDEDVKDSRQDKKAAALAKKEAARKEKEAAKQAKLKAKTKGKVSKNKKTKVRKPFPTKIVAIVAGALAVIVAAVLFVPNLISSISNNGWNPNSSLPKNVEDMGSPLVLGNKDASTTLSIWTDFHGLFGKEHQVYAGDFVQLAAEKGKIRAEYYMTAYLDQDGSEGSLRAANASLCAADQDKFFEFLDYSFDRQPVGFIDPTDSTGQSYIIPDGYTEKELLSWSSDLGIANKGQYDNCVKSIQYRNYIDSVTKAFTENKYTQIPTILLNGSELDGNNYRLDLFADTLGVPWTDVTEIRKAIEEQTANTEESTEGSTEEGKTTTPEETTPPTE